MTRRIPELRRPGHVGYRGLDAPEACGCEACDALGRAMDADILARRRVAELAAEVDRAHGLDRHRKESRP